MESQYTPQNIEKKWYRHWEESGVFKPKGNGKSFTIVIPPPNVTGVLHMGHALNNTIQDVLVRYKKMQGLKVLWQPGTDHAGIATQSVVEHKLLAEGINPKKMSRTDFIDQVWKWKEEYGHKIVDQLKKMGCSCDWSKLRFTMDEGLNLSVRNVFVEYFKKGLIYPGKKLINWCPQLMTALADEEVEVKETKGYFWSIRYPLVDAHYNNQDYLVVSTTRPETLFGDMALAVNPNDERYKQLIGKKIRIPLTERIIPILADEHANPKKGSGVVKITPAHDFNDYEVGLKYNLELLTVMNPNATMNHHAGEYQGLDRFVCRKKVIEDLKSQGLLHGIEDKEISMPHCYRSGDIIEPRLMRQWFVKMEPIAKPAVESVKEGKTKFIPARYSKTYFDWLEQYRDWCISRQIWWGHQIPVWYVVSETGVQLTDETPFVVALDEEQAQKEAQQKFGSQVVLKQDEDVLDTWFSSALWSFSALGWPEKTEELKEFYPTSVLVTARDIIYFWVARMMFSGLYFLDKEPFHTVYVHGTVLDEKGQRMSKSKGNGINPLDMIDQYGTDAVRFSLLILTSEGQDIKLSPSKFEMGRHFANKLWNSARFLLPHLQNISEESINYEKLDDANRWILASLQDIIDKITESLENYRFSEVCQVLYHFVWDDFCSQYLEIKKRIVLSEKQSEDKQQTLLTFQETFRCVLRLLHPFMPFITAEIYNFFFPNQELAFEPWPVSNKQYQNQEILVSFSQVLELVKVVRSIRGRYKVPLSQNLNLSIYLEKGGWESTQEFVLRQLEKIDSLQIQTTIQTPPFAASKVFLGGIVFVLLEGIVDQNSEINKVKEELQKIKTFVMGIEKKLNSGFTQKAPAEVVEKEKQKLEDQKEKQEKLLEVLKSLT